MSASDNRLVEPIGHQVATFQGDWAPLLQAWAASEAGGRLIEQVDARLAAGATIFPSQVFRALALMNCNDGKGAGAFNYGNYCNPKVDALTRQVQSETDTAKRNAQIQEALKIVADDVGYLPLHQQYMNWGVSKNVELVQMADGFMPFKWMTVKK